MTTADSPTTARAITLAESDSRSVDIAQKISSERFGEVRQLTERLAAPLSAEDQTVQSMPDVSPTKWHLAHVSWFFETFLLNPYLDGYEEYHPKFGYLFNSYYEAIGDRYPRPARGLVSRPSVEQILAYRRHVDENMFRLLDRSLNEQALSLVELGMHHEQQHQELILMDIKHVLSMNPLDPEYLTARMPTHTPNAIDAGWVSHDGGAVRVGHTGRGFAFDNEGSAHTTYLVPFEIADRTVTCEEWKAFIDDGGYQRPELWLSDGWAAVQTHDLHAPMYWRIDDDEWTIFTLLGRRVIEANEPVCHISYYEADAFARWAGARLPTEFEWEAVASAQPLAGAFLDSDYPHPRPQTESAFFGDVWVWTGSAYLPYPGFHPSPGAVGEYNGKFMVGQHVLRGGSCATPANHIRVTYRNFFPPAARWAFAGLRLARDL